MVWFGGLACGPGSRLSVVQTGPVQQMCVIAVNNQSIPTCSLNLTLICLSATSSAAEVVVGGCVVAVRPSYERRGEEEGAGKVQV